MFDCKNRGYIFETDTRLRSRILIIAHPFRMVLPSLWILCYIINIRNVYGVRS